MIKIASVLLALAFIGFASASPSVEQYCSGEPIKLNTVGDVLPLVESLKAGSATGGCSEEARQAILDLEPIVKADNVCSEEVARSIGRYYATYVERSHSLSKSVSDYFLAVGLKISELCEKAMMENLNTVSDERIPVDDAKELVQISKKLRDFTRLVAGEDMDIQNLFVVTDMEGILSVPVTIGSQTVSVDAETKKTVDRVKELCRNQFKPIYEKLITPLVILTNVGLEYNSGDIREDRDNFREEHGYQNWFRVVSICESAFAQRVIEAPKSSKEIDEHKVTILDKDDLAKLNEQAEEAQSTGSPSEFELSVHLSESEDLATDEMRAEVNSVSEKRELAENMRQNTMKSLMKSLGKLLQSGKVHFGLASEATNEASKKKALLESGSASLGLMLVSSL